MVTIESVTSWAELEETIRQTPLLQDSDIHPYEDATIALRSFSYDQVRTTSLYVARSLLRVQKLIADDIAQEGYDPLELDCGLVLGGTDENNMPIAIGFVPPIVEETDQEGPYLLDGSHRTNQGRWLGKSAFTAIHITGIRQDCPAYALPNEWSDVRIYDTVPDDPALRKKYRQDRNIYALYRNFEPLNGSTPRPERNA